jgi:hypothetical protein
MPNFEEAVSIQDISIFERIKSQLSDHDKGSLLAAQHAARGLLPAYNYLEIGSYLGGSIQPHLLDPKCSVVYSIDKRPLHQPDSRGANYTYLNNSTARMLELLSELAPTDKIKTIDGDTRQLSPDVIKEPMQLCFVDGEHTDEAVFSDFRFCLNVLDKNGGTITFHDTAITYNGIANCLQYLKENNIKFRAYGLPSMVFVIELGNFPLHQNPAVMQRLIDNHDCYIYSLQYNDYYRQFANKPLFRLYRSMLVKWRRSNVCE